MIAPKPPTDVKGPARVGIVFGMLVLGGFALWAALVPIASAVIAAGVVKVDSSRKSIQHLEGGIVSEILVDDGDRVEAGQVLVRLDQTRASASKGVLQGSYFNALAQQARLFAERDGLDRIEFPEQLLEQADDPRVSGILRTQRELFHARRESHLGQLEILKQQISHLNEDIQGLRAQQKAKRRQVDSINDELVGLNKLLANGMIDRTRVLALQREGAEVEGEYGELTSQIAAARNSIGEKELEQFQLKKTFQEEVATELRQVESDLIDYRERLLAASHTLEQTEIRAPVSGVIVSRGVHTLGGVVAPGEVILELVPSDDHLVIEARISPVDVDNVQVGFDAGVRFSAFNQRTTPELLGNLSYVSADIIENEKTGELYYRAKVVVPEDQLARLDPSKVIQPGMPADVLIRTGERTLFDYIVEPLLVNFRKALRET